MKRSVLAFTLLAAVAHANAKPFSFLKSKFSRKVKVTDSEEEWPAVHYVANFEIHGGMYTYNAETKELEPFNNMKVSQYLDSTDNREKVIT